MNRSVKPLEKQQRSRQKTAITRQSIRRHWRLRWLPQAKEFHEAIAAAAYYDVAADDASGSTI